MPFGEIGAFLLLLAAVFLFGNLWFHLIEAVHLTGEHGESVPRLSLTSSLGEKVSYHPPLAK